MDMPNGEEAGLSIEHCWVSIIFLQDVRVLMTARGLTFLSFQAKKLDSLSLTPNATLFYFRLTVSILDRILCVVLVRSK
jgi:hypothetical protein